MYRARGTSTLLAGGCLDRWLAISIFSFQFSFFQVLSLKFEIFKFQVSSLSFFFSLFFLHNHRPSSYQAGTVRYSYGGVRYALPQSRDRRYGGGARCPSWIQKGLPLTFCDVDDLKESKSRPTQNPCREPLLASLLAGKRPDNSRPPPRNDPTPPTPPTL